MEKIIVGLIRGRHPIPVEDYLFDEVKDVHDYKAIRCHINEFLKEKVGIEVAYGVGLDQASYETIQVFQGKRELIVYVTGLTSVTAELIRACLYNGVRLTLMHYDSSTGEYLPQKIQ